MDPCEGGNLQIHRPHPDSSGPEFIELLRGPVVEGRNRERGIESEQAGQLAVGRDLAPDESFLGDDRQLAAHLLFDRYNGHGHHFSAGQIRQPLNETACSLTTWVLEQ